MPRDFAELQRQLEEAVLKLKQTKDPQVRRALLQEMRILLQEAEGSSDRAAEHEDS
jgi:hypothetical protein